jgi:hypothetical protein
MKRRSITIVLLVGALSVYVAFNTWQGTATLRGLSRFANEDARATTTSSTNTTSSRPSTETFIHSMHRQTWNNSKNSSDLSHRENTSSSVPHVPGAEVGNSSLTVNGTTATTEKPTIYFVVTTSLMIPTHEEGQKDADVRRDQYFRGIRALLNATKSGFPLPHRVVVVENNGLRKTYLDDLEGVSVLYTDNNNVNDTTVSKGTKELRDVLAAVRHFQMRANDLVVKMTGRYYLDEQSSFMELLRHLDWNVTQALVKFGPYYRPSDAPMRDCITGLIMLPVAAIRSIKPADIIEHSWADAALSLPPSAVHAIQGRMGINIAPGGSVKYYTV